MKGISAPQYHALRSLVRWNAEGRGAREGLKEAAQSLEGLGLTARGPDGLLRVTSGGHTALRCFEVAQGSWTP